MDDIFYNRFDEKCYSFKGLLPHLNQERKAQFVTFHLADSLPQSKINELTLLKEQFLKAHPRPWSDVVRGEYSVLLSPRVSRILDNGHGKCILVRQDIRQIVVDSLLYLNGLRYDLLAAVVMPNHVHMLIVPAQDESLANIVQSLKSFTAHKINQLLGESGTIWQSDYYDRIIRTPKHLDNCIDYIKANASQAGPGRCWLYIRPE